MTPVTSLLIKIEGKTNLFSFLVYHVHKLPGHCVTAVRVTITSPGRPLQICACRPWNISSTIFVNLLKIPQGRCWTLPLQHSALTKIINSFGNTWGEFLKRQLNKTRQHTKKYMYLNCFRSSTLAIKICKETLITPNACEYHDKLHDKLSSRKSHEMDDRWWGANTTWLKILPW